MNAANNLVETDELVAWKRMKEERRERTITKLLHAVEESALALANNYKTPTELQIKAADMGEAVRNTLACPPPACFTLWVIVVAFSFCCCCFFSFLSERRNESVHV